MGSLGECLKLGEKNGPLEIFASGTLYYYRNGIWFKNHIAIGITYRQDAGGVAGWQTRDCDVTLMFTN